MPYLSMLVLVTCASSLAYPSDSGTCILENAASAELRFCDIYRHLQATVKPKAAHAETGFRASVLSILANAIGMAACTCSLPRISHAASIGNVAAALPFGGRECFRT